MVADRRLNQLNGATRECLEQCYQSDDWLLSLASYAERLRSDGWSRADIGQVEATVRRILGAVVEAESLSLQTVRETPTPNSPDLASA
jgi:hypothetical protein